MAAKKVALFVDVDCLHQHLRNLHNRPLDPRTFMEAARAQGDVVQAAAVADWSALPDELKAGFESESVEVVDVPRTQRSRESGGRRREILHDRVDLEILARVVELLFSDGAPEVDAFLLGTSDDVAARTAGLIKERFHKGVFGLGVEGASCDALQAALDGYAVLELPPIEPQDEEGLSKLVPLLEDLERRKRYLNFKYIRETVVRRLELPERSFDAAERLLSDAIACGILLKLKIDDKYNPGQLFTAYCLNRESPYFQQWGSGEPAPVHEEPEEPAAAPAEASSTPALPSLGRSGGDSKPRAKEKEREREREKDAPREKEAREPREPRRGRRRRGGGGNGSEPESVTAGGGGSGGGRKRRRRRGRGKDGGEDKIKLAAGGGGRRGGPRNHQQDRVGRMYEAPSRFLSEEQERPVLADDDIDEERILRARGD